MLLHTAHIGDRILGIQLLPVATSAAIRVMVYHKGGSLSSVPYTQDRGDDPHHRTRWTGNVFYSPY